MQISKINNSQINFRAHFYKIEPRDKKVYVQTDNKPYLGEKPYLVWYNDNEEKIEEKMEKEGDLYSVKSCFDAKPETYHIEYKDTKKIDVKNGKRYFINPELLMQKASVATRIQYRQPIIHTIKEGKTVGKIKYQDSNVWKKNDDIKEPTIIVTRTFHSEIDNPNIVGLILTLDDIAGYSHLGTRLRQEVDVCGAVPDTNIANELKSLNGKNVEIELKDNQIFFKETDKPAKPMEFKTIEVPKMKYCNKILTSKEYSPDVIGAKAVNLRRLEELKEKGKIDVIIPKSIALPHNYLEPYMEKLSGVTKDEKFEEYCEQFDKFVTDGEINPLIDYIKKSGLNYKDGLMVRSAFNGEDLPNYSAAGIYKTYASGIDAEGLFDSIRIVANSKNGHDAIFSRKMYNIPEEKIQPGVIIQERIVPDYKFTLYTDDKKGNVKVELYSDKKWYNDNANLPNVFIYNKKTGKLNYNSVQMINPMATFNEDGDLTELEPVKYDLSEKKDLFEQIKKLCQNALVIEKEFGHPQDIEGGFKDNNIYLWQSRNIV
jgi:hypothetical protein